MPLASHKPTGWEIARDWAMRATAPLLLAVILFGVHVESRLSVIEATTPSREERTYLRDTAMESKQATEFIREGMLVIQGGVANLEDRLVEIEARLRTIEMKLEK